MRLVRPHLTVFRLDIRQRPALTAGLNVLSIQLCGIVIKTVKILVLFIPAKAMALPAAWESAVTVNMPAANALLVIFGETAAVGKRMNMTVAALDVIMIVV